MSLIEKIGGSFFFLILLYLITKNAESVNNFLSASGKAINQQVLTLQGRGSNGSSGIQTVSFDGSNGGVNVTLA